MQGIHTMTWFSNPISYEDRSNERIAFTPTPYLKSTKILLFGTNNVQTYFIWCPHEIYFNRSCHIKSSTRLYWNTLEEICEYPQFSRWWLFVWIALCDFENGIAFCVEKYREHNRYGLAFNFVPNIFHPDYSRTSVSKVWYCFFHGRGLATWVQGRIRMYIVSLSPH